MAKPALNAKKIVALTGAGISASSGLATFRSSGGLWEQHRIADVATPEAWARDPETVLRFYNARREAMGSAKPNAAHVALARLESNYEVIVITQNVDDLHERAGSTRVIHLHGELRKARSSSDPAAVIDIGYSPLSLGQVCPNGSQLRPHIVWFGEEVMHLQEARKHIKEASKFLVVGTSLSVFPAAGLVKHSRFSAERIIVDVDPPSPPFGFRVMRGSADTVLPGLVESWLSRPERT